MFTAIGLVWSEPRWPTAWNPDLRGMEERKYIDTVGKNMIQTKLCSRTMFPV